MSGSYDAIVLDLRGNTGGLLNAVAVIAGQFLPPEAIFKTISNEQTEDVYAEPNCRSEPVTQPLAIWIDQHTDSGAALLAAALQDRGRAKIIGESKAQMNGAILTIMFPPSRTLLFTVPAGELARINDVPLSAGVRPDVSVIAADEGALIRETIALISSGAASPP